MRQQRAERYVGAVAAGPVTAGAGRHEDGAGQHGRRLEHQFVVRGGGRRFAASLGAGVQFLDSRQQRIERDLLQHEPAIVAAIVHGVRIPLAEVVVGALAGRMVEVVGPRVEGQLVQHLEVEPGLLQDFRVGLGQDVQRLPHQFAIRPAGHAHLFDVQRNRSHPLVCVRLHLLLRLEYGHRPVADVVVQLVERAVDDPLGFVPRSALRHERF